MTSEFERDLARVNGLIEEGRRNLLVVVDRLGPDDLERVLRGGWDIRGVLRHIIESEHHYAGLVERLRGGTPAGSTANLDLASPSDVRRALESSRKALVAAIQGVDEEAFYRLGGGGQEYSVVSVLENVHQHDEEHRAQVERIRDTAASPHKASARP
jgi:uncharacterized damage-inducible protein DinB